ncbi:MAG TPA: ATPase, T2SS/T4P/T4SS family, partial [bacterium]|nr:ATPase, T2SS/T4P/T4SS family [bacterium]
MLYQNTALYNKIKELNVIDSKSLESCLKEAESQNLPLDVILTKKDLIKDNDVGRLISELISFPYVTIKDESIPKDILNIIPEIVAKKQSAVLFDKNKEGLKLATTNPLNNEFFDMIRKKTGEFLSIYYTTEKNIQEALSLYNEPLQKAYESLLITHIKNSEKDKNTEVPVSKIVDTLVQYAYQNKASDIHIEPKDNASTIRFRIDGVLHEVLSIPLELHEKITSRIKVMSKLRTDEHMSAQDGKLNVALQMENLDIRVSIVPIVKGEKIVLRLLSSNSRQFSLQDLGMDE